MISKSSSKNIRRLHLEIHSIVSDTSSLKMKKWCERHVNVALCWFKQNWLYFTRAAITAVSHDCPAPSANNFTRRSSVIEPTFSEEHHQNFRISSAFKITPFPLQCNIDSTIALPTDSTGTIDEHSFPTKGILWINPDNGPICVPTKVIGAPIVCNGTTPKGPKFRGP